MFLDDQQSIPKKFEELLQYADRMFTLVLVVGDDTLFKDVFDKISKTFISHDSCKNLPVVKHIPIEKAQNLKCKWSYSAEEIDTKVHGYIADKKSFIFYRHGSYSNVCESAEEAVVEICTICMDEYLLVVGDDNGIEGYIQNDIQIVAYLAGLSNKDFKTLHEKLQKASDPCKKYKSQLIGKNAVFTLLVLPCVDQLKKELKEEIQRPHRMLTVIYSGHGYPDGT